MTYRHPDELCLETCFREGRVRLYAPVKIKKKVGQAMPDRMKNRQNKVVIKKKVR